MWTFVSKVMFLLSLIRCLGLSQVFLPRSKCLLISWLQSPSGVTFEPKKIKSVTISIVSPSIWHELMGLGAMIFGFWMLSFKPAFSLFSFTFIKRLFRSSSFCHKGGIFCISEVIDIPPRNLDSNCASSSLAFRMMYSACKLNKRGDNIQPWHTPFTILNLSRVPSLVLTVASWPAYSFPRMQVEWSGIPISLRIFHSLFCST